MSGGSTVASATSLAAMARSSKRACSRRLRARAMRTATSRSIGLASSASIATVVRDSSGQATLRRVRCWTSRPTGSKTVDRDGTHPTRRTAAIQRSRIERGFSRTQAICRSMRFRPHTSATARDSVTSPVTRDPRSWTIPPDALQCRHGRSRTCDRGIIGRASRKPS